MLGVSCRIDIDNYEMYFGVTGLGVIQLSFGTLLPAPTKICHFPVALTSQCRDYLYGVTTE